MQFLYISHMTSFHINLKETSKNKATKCSNSCIIYHKYFLLTTNKQEVEEKGARRNMSCRKSGIV